MDPIEVDLIPRFGAPDRDLDSSDEAALSRIGNNGVRAFKSGAPTIQVIQLYKQIRSLGPIHHLLEELTFLDRWLVQLPCPDGRSLRLDPAGLRMYSVLHHVARLIDVDGWYSGHYYETTFSISQDRLRQAARRGQLPVRKEGNRNLYPYRAVRKRYPDEIKFPEIP